MNLNSRKEFNMLYGTLSNYDSLDAIKDVMEISKPVSMVFDHRLVLASWILWKDIKNKPLNLLTFDAHRDLCSENDTIQIMEHIEKTTKEKLDLRVFELLDVNNDTHINMACELGVFDSVFVISNDFSDEDYCVNKSRIKVFKELDDCIVDILSKSFYILDIDLDYFFDKDDCTNSFQFNELRLKSFLEKKTIFPNNLVGITIAIEPRYCGGIVNAINVYEKIEKKLFSAPVFRDYYQEDIAVLSEVLAINR